MPPTRPSQSAPRENATSAPRSTETPTTTTRAPSPSTERSGLVTPLLTGRSATATAAAGDSSAPRTVSSFPSGGTPQAGNGQGRVVLLRLLPGQRNQACLRDRGHLLPQP